MGSIFTGNQINEDGSSGGLRISGFLPQSRPRRRTVTEIYPVSAGYSNAFPNVPPLPPAYGETDNLPPSRFKVLPREEEGREELPAYSCSLHKEAVLDRKMELRSPFERSHQRRWKKCYLVLHGTKLEIHKPKKITFFSSTKKVDPNRPVGYRPGKLLESYTLQLAEVGTAIDYKKRHFAIRLRVQTVQFLLSCRTLEVFLDWLEALSAAIDLSPSLEERFLPRYQTLPRRRRRRGNAAGAQVDATPLGRQDANQESSDIISPAASTHPTTPPRLRRVQSPPEEEEVPFDTNGKWAPRNRLTREANLRYARRCMAALTSDAPRQSEFVICKGKRYRLLYESKKMVPDGGEPEDTTAVHSGKRSATGKGKGKEPMAEERDKSPPRLPEYDEVVGVAMVVTAW